MIVRAMIATLILCLGCSPAADTSPAPDPTAAQAGAAQNAPTETAYCEFSIGHPAPSGLQPMGMRTIPTEGDERTFADYRACDGRVPITIELRDTSVWSIRIKGVGNCVEETICVGDSYRQSVERFPGARQLLSREEGKTFSLLVREGLTLIFPAESLADECYVRPGSCTEQIQQSRVEAIFLYDQ